MSEKNSQALLEVWRWKEEAYQEVAHLPIQQALKKRLEDSLRSVQQLGLTVSTKRVEQTSMYAPHHV